MRRLLALLLGLALTFVMLELGLRLSAGAYVASQLRAEAPDSTAVRTVLAVGESTTVIAAEPTHGLLVTSSSWPRQLEQMLNERSEDTWRVINRAVLNGTSEEIVNGLEADLVLHRPEVVVAMMGMKDQAPQQAGTDDQDGDRRPGLWASLRTVRLLTELSGSPSLTREDFVPGEVTQWSEVPPRFRTRVEQQRHMVKETRVLNAPPMVTDAIDLGIYYWLIGQPARAESTWRALMKTRRMGANLVARVMLDRGDQDGAEAVLREAMVRRPEEGLYAEVLARTLTAAGRTDEAVEVLTTAISKPCMKQAAVRRRQYLALATVQVQAGRPLEAQEALRHVGEREVESRLGALIGRIHPELELVTAEVSAALGQLDAAQDKLEAALKRDPGLNEAMVLLERIYREQGREELAEPLRTELLFQRRRVAEFYLLAKQKRQAQSPDTLEELYETALEGVPLADNYLQLYETSRAHGAQVLAVQYPTFGLDLLRLYVPDRDDLRLVDTEHIFDDVPPETVFLEPRFPYNFAHYTHEGARLLAERIAPEVLGLP
ncbi:MAG: hypothetical protein QGG40_01710 [Myxococcota bacterium]|nr:hypothetical protein [Myxococcota bacterium]